MEVATYFINRRKVYPILQGVTLEISVVVPDSFEFFCIHRHQAVFRVSRTLVNFGQPYPVFELRKTLTSSLLMCPGGSILLLEILLGLFLISVSLTSQIWAAFTDHWFTTRHFYYPGQPIYIVCAHQWRWVPEKFTRLCGQSKSPAREKYCTYWDLPLFTPVCS